MSLFSETVRGAIVGVVLSVAAPLAFAPASAPAHAEDAQISPSHLAAALAAAKATGAMGGFDAALALITETVENDLIRQRPDAFREIKAAAEDQIVKLVPRRIDLDNDVARVWAKLYSEDELKAIAAFFNSDAGKKYRDSGTKAVSDTYGALNAWSNRVGSELADKTKEALKGQGIDF
jgi:hypothetical protein